MSLTQSTDVSSSTLGLPEMDTPPYHPLSPPPPRDVKRYETRGLPPLPLGAGPTKRNSGVSTFSKEVDEALATPESVVSPDEGSIYLMFCHEGASDIGDAEIAYATDRQADKRQKREDLRVNTAGVVRAHFGTPLSPQPKSSIRKVFQISGVQNAPTFRETTPTGHNSEKKIHRLTGLGVAPELTEQQRQIRAEQQKQLYWEISPLSTNSDDYGHDSPRTAVSGLDGDTEAGREYPSEASSEYFNSKHFHRRGTGSSAIPDPLRVTKPVRPSRSPERTLPGSPRHGEHSSRLPLSPRLESARASPGCDVDAPSGESAPELYHEAAKQLAKEDARAAQLAKREKRRLLAARQFIQAGSAVSIDSRQSSKDKSGQPRLPQPSCQRTFPGSRPQGSTEPANPVWRPSNFPQDTPRAASASTFGHLPHRFRAQHSVSPSASPDPGLRSAFDYDSDTNDNSNTIGTPETGGSIPISIGSDKSGKGSKQNATAPRRRSHGSSIMAKVFRRSGASSTSTPNNTPVDASPPPFPPTTHPHRHRHRHRHKPSTSTSISASAHSSPRSQSRGSPTPKSTALFHRGPSPQAKVGAGDRRPMTTKTSLSSLAAGLLSKSASLGNIAQTFSSNLVASGDERRRQRLKSRIRVLPGGQVSGISPGIGSGFGSGSGSGSVGSLGVVWVGGGAGSGHAQGQGVDGAGFRGRLGSAPAASASPVAAPGPVPGPATFWAGQPGDGSVWGKGSVVPGLEVGGGWGLERKSPRPVREQGVGSNVSVRGGSPRPTTGTSGKVSGLRARSRQGTTPMTTPRGSPARQGPDAVRGESPRGSPRPRKKDTGSSPRPSADRGRDGAVKAQGLGIRLGGA